MRYGVDRGEGAVLRSALMALRHAFASTFWAGAIVVFIPWRRGAETRAANQQRA